MTEWMLRTISLEVKEQGQLSRERIPVPPSFTRLARIDMAGDMSKLHEARLKLRGELEAPPTLRRFRSDCISGVLGSLRSRANLFCLVDKPTKKKIPANRSLPDLKTEPGSVSSRGLSSLSPATGRWRSRPGQPRSRRSCCFPGRNRSCG